jgi:hypothetical protein
MRTRRYIETNKMESSDVRHTTETASAMVHLGVNGIRRKLRVKLWGKNVLWKWSGEEYEGKEKRKLDKYL